MSNPPSPIRTLITAPGPSATLDAFAPASSRADLMCGALVPDQDPARLLLDRQRHRDARALSAPASSMEGELFS